MNAMAEKITAAWGTAPDWIAVLAEECGKTSQARVAKALGVSSTVISRVLGNSYAGDMGKIEQLVRGHYMAATVDCPVLGEIPRQRCLKEQARKLSFQNPLRKRIYEACRNGCPHSRLNKEGRS